MPKTSLRFNVQVQDSLNAERYTLHSHVTGEQAAELKRLNTGRHVIVKPVRVGHATIEKLRRVEC